MELEKDYLQQGTHPLICRFSFHLRFFLQSKDLSALAKLDSKHESEMADFVQRRDTQAFNRFLLMG